MATTNLELKLAQARVLNGALIMEVCAGANVIARAQAGGHRYIVETVGNNVKVKFGIPFSFVAPANTTITKIDIRSYDFEETGEHEIIFSAPENKIVETDDIVFVNEVSFTLLD